MSYDVTIFRPFLRITQQSFLLIQFFSKFYLALENIFTSNQDSPVYFNFPFSSCETMAYYVEMLLPVLSGTASVKGSSIPSTTSAFRL